MEREVPPIARGENRVTDAIVRHRGWLLGLVVALQFISYNGQWRMGLDSAVYRGLARSLARGEGYAFGDWAGGHVYFGLPYLLAGFERVFGGAVWPVVLSIMAMALGCLLLTYRLIAMHYPQWMAVCVAAGVGVNARFLKLSHELLTDVPFLFGLLTALYARERAALRARWGCTAAMAGGLFLAGSMRPTFWIVAAVWGAVEIAGLARARPRARHALSLGVLAAVVALLVAMDPRTGRAGMIGGYEREAIAKLGEATATLRVEVPRLMQEHLTTAVIGQHGHLPRKLFGPWRTIPAILLSGLLIASIVLVIRRQPLWGWIALLTIPVTAVLSTVPRYYVMILPILLLGFTLSVAWAVDRMRRRWGEALLVGAIALVALNNVAALVSFVIEQRSLPFMEHYHKGRFATAVRMAEVIRASTPTEARVIGPWGSLLSYLSDRHVLNQREVMGDGGGVDPARIAAVAADAAVFPYVHYLDKDRRTAHLLRTRQIVPQRVVAAEEGFYLATFAVSVPPSADGEASPTQVNVNP